LERTLFINESTAHAKRTIKNEFQKKQSRVPREIATCRFI